MVGVVVETESGEVESYEQRERGSVKGKRSGIFIVKKKTYYV